MVSDPRAPVTQDREDCYWSLHEYWLRVSIFSTSEDQSEALCFFLRLTKILWHQVSSLQRMEDCRLTSHGEFYR